MENYFSTVQHNSTAQGIANSNTDCFIISAMQLFHQSGLLRTLTERKWDTDATNPIVTELKNLRIAFKNRERNNELPLKVESLRKALSDANCLYQSGNLGDAWDVINFMFNAIHDCYAKISQNGQDYCCPVHEIFGIEGIQVEFCLEKCQSLKKVKCCWIEKKAYIIMHSVKISEQENWLPSLGLINERGNEDLKSFMLQQMAIDSPRSCSFCHNPSYKKAYFFSEKPKYLLLHLKFGNFSDDLPRIVFSNFEKLQSIPCKESWYNPEAFWYNAVGFILYIEKRHYSAIIYSRKKKVWQVMDDHKKILLEDYDSIRKSEPFIALYRRSKIKATYNFPVFSQLTSLPIEPNYITPPNSSNLEPKSSYIPTREFASHKICQNCSAPNPIYNSACIFCRSKFNTPIFI